MMGAILVGFAAGVALAAACVAVSWWLHEAEASRHLARALADRIYAAHEVLGRLAERRAVTITERDSCPLG